MRIHDDVEAAVEWHDHPAVGRVIVVGGGTMGAGIVHVLLAAGADVVLVEGDAASAASALARVLQSLERRPDVDVVPSADLVEHLHVHVGVPSGCGADLVIEAVPEQVELKLSVLAAIDAACDGAVVATNTSSLSVDVLAEALRDPSRLVGMHFFNPVPPSRLIEVVAGVRSSESAIDVVMRWVTLLGKEQIRVKDSPGLATSRLGVAIALEAMRMVEEGVASAADIDRGMVLGYRFPVGPLELTDRVGLDVRLAIAQHLERELGSRFRPPDLLRAMVAEGALGRKAGRGFYSWGPEGRR
jgi:3-hydroxybutyryl-CoA dehydrogenase